jgi:hypothetical protein
VLKNLAGKDYQDKGRKCGVPCTKELGTIEPKHISQTEKRLAQRRVSCGTFKEGHFLERNIKPK